MLVTTAEHRDADRFSRSGKYGQDAGKNTPGRKDREAKKHRKPRGRFILVTVPRKGEKGLIVLDAGVGDLLTLFPGDMVRFESYGFHAFSRCFRDDGRPFVTEVKYVEERENGQIGDPEAEERRRKEEWEEAFPGKMQ